MNSGGSEKDKAENIPATKQGGGVDIAIVGMACRFPGAQNYNQFWRNLEEGIDSIKEIPADRWNTRDHFSPAFEAQNKSNSKWCGLVDDIDKFDNRFFNTSPREANNMDPQQRLLLEETWRCLENSGVPLSLLQQRTTSVYMGVMFTDYHHEATAPGVPIDSYSGTGNYDCLLANRLSYFFGLTGPSMALNAACASSLVALHEAKKSLLAGESHYALAGGVSLNLHPFKYVSFSKSRMLSPEGKCFTFDIAANGYVPGDGVGVVLMQRLEDAIAEGNHIYGVLKGSSVNHVGRALSLTAPRVETQRDLILAAYKEADLLPDSVTYVEAHGTGTSLGDPIEIEALTQAFRETTDERQFCKVGSVKTNIGHLEASAGVAGLIKVLLMMKHRKIPKSLNVQTPNPVIDFESSPFGIASELEDWSPRIEGQPLRAGVSSFGMGGANSHALIEEHLGQPSEDKTSGAGEQTFVLSAKSPASLEGLLAEWRQFVTTTDFSELNLKDICGTLNQSHRANFPYRWGTILKDTGELAGLLKAALPLDPGKYKKNWCWRIGDFGFDSLAPFEGELHQSAIFEQHLGRVEDCFLRATGEKSALSEFRNGMWPDSHRAIFSFVAVYAALSTLRDIASAPEVITGEGAGTLVALTLSGIVGLEDALALLSKQKVAGDIELHRPEIPYYDPLTGRTFLPHAFEESYPQRLREALLGSAGPDLEKAFHYYYEKARLLRDKQFTFQKYLEEWAPVLKQQGRDLLQMLYEKPP